MDVIERAFAYFRINPWTTTGSALRALTIADSAASTPALTLRAFAALEQPFANLAVNERRLVVRLQLALRLSRNDACLPVLEAFGDRVPWLEGFLRSRRDCYQINRDPRIATASRDLTAFLANEAPSLPADQATAARQ